MGEAPANGKEETLLRPKTNEKLLSRDKLHPFFALSESWDGRVTRCFIDLEREEGLDEQRRRLLRKKSIAIVKRRKMWGRKK